MSVKVTFNYEPDEVDDDDSTGMTEDEYGRLVDGLMQTYGAENITVVKEA